MRARLASLAVLISTCLTKANSEHEFRPWSTEALEWTTPDNITIHAFGNDIEHHYDLRWPLTHPLVLRVYEGEDCASATSETTRPLWWAEVRRQAALDEGISLGQIEVNDLPTPLHRGLLDWQNQVKQDPSVGRCPSVIALFPATSDGRELVLSPPGREGMRRFIEWLQPSLRVDCYVANPFADKSVELFWVDDSTDERRVAEVPPSRSVPQNTFIGHMFVAREKGTGKVIDWWSMTGQPVYTIQDRAREVQEQCSAEHEQQCRTPDQALFEYIYVASFAKRHALNTVQPFIAHNYTDLGFKKIPMPPETFKWLREWYDANEHAEIVEGNAGAVGTQHEAPWYVRHIPPHLKTRLTRELLPILSEWSGFDAKDLAMTSCYGIRRYSRGARLRMHVDTMMTHVVSTIINVDQRNMNSDWALEIKAHDGQYAYVHMQPGDMLFYESAKCLHGRPMPLDGDSYSNIFLHFQPTKEELWPYSWY